MKTVSAIHHVAAAVLHTLFFLSAVGPAVASQDNCASCAWEDEETGNCIVKEYCLDVWEEGNRQNSQTACYYSDDASGGVLSVCLTSAGTAQIAMSITLDPTQGRSSVLWRIQEADATPSSGSFGGQPLSVTLAPNPDRTFLVQAGCDTENRNGQLDDNEVNVQITVHILEADLDVDSDNDNGFASPDRSEAEDEIEEQAGLPGKLLCVNDSDADGDGVPNFADGFNLWGNAGFGAGGDFTPMVLELPSSIDVSVAQVRFSYSASDPAGVTRSGTGTPEDPYVYTPAPGDLRIWTVNGSATRSKAEVSAGGHFVHTGSEYAALDLGLGVAQRTTTLYLEGIDPSSTLGEQQLQVLIDPDGPGPAFYTCPDMVRVTVLKVDSVEWEAIESPIDNNPNANGGKRLFPGKADPTDTTPRNTVRVKATITPAIQDVTLYFKAFDVDDPTPASVDTTSEIDTNGDSGNDNHGSPAAGTLSAATATTDSSGETTVDFTVTMQPGDNFRVAVSCNQQAVDELTVTDSSSPKYVTPDNAQISAFSGALSPMLTVWRSLWLEFDSMGPPPTSGAEKNFDEGTVDSIQADVPATGQSTLNLSVKLTDEKNRYEEGFIIIDGTKYPVVSNTDNLVFDDDVVITGTPGAGVVGKPFKIYDDDFDMTTVQHIRTLPYTLSGGSLMDTAYAEAYIKPKTVPASYVDSDSTFYRNLSSGLFSGWLSKVTAKKDLSESAEFWLVHLLAAWQGKTDEDIDPDTADPGEPAPEATNGEASDPDNTGAIYIETIRESEILTHFPRINEEHTVVHEVGHQGGGDHLDGGIMDYGAPIDEDHFSPITIKRFREESEF